MKRRAADQRGFSLIEILVSVGIFGITSMCVAKAFIFHLSTNTISEQKTSAYQAAQLKLDELRLVDPGIMQSSGFTTENRVVGKRTFGVKTTYCSKPAFCPSTNTKHIEVRVTYKGKELYAVETVFAQLK